MFSLKQRIKNILEVYKNFGLEYVIVHLNRFFLKRLSLFDLSENYVIASRFYNLLKDEKALNELKNFKSENIEDIYYFAKYFYSGLIRPYQADCEFLKLLEIYKNLKPKRVLEIGTFVGGTLFCFTKLAQDDAIIISIDLPFGKVFNASINQNIGNTKIDIYITKVFEHFIFGNQRLYLLRQSSNDENTVQKLKRVLGNNKLDFIFIDGDHSYDAVKKDFELYYQFIDEGGVIAFHDISEYMQKTVGDLSKLGVHKFWNELKSSKEKYNFKEYQEILASNYSFGIGIIYF